MALIRKKPAASSFHPFAVYNILISICHFLPPETVFNIIKLISTAQHTMISSDEFMQHYYAHYFPSFDLPSHPAPISFQTFLNAYRMAHSFFPNFAAEEKYASIPGSKELANKYYMENYQIMNACITEDLLKFKAICSNENRSLNQHKTLCDVIVAPYPTADSNEFFYIFLMRTGRSVCLDYLVNFEFFPNEEQCAEHHPFILAARFGRLDVMRYQLEKHPEWLNVRDYDKQSALHWAVYHNYVEVVKFLIDQKVDLIAKNAKNNKDGESIGTTALGLALQMQHTHVAMLLIRYLTFNQKEKIYTAISSLPEKIIKKITDKIEHLSAPGQRLLFFPSPFLLYFTNLKKSLENIIKQTKQSPVLSLERVFAFIVDEHNVISKVPLIGTGLSEFLQGLMWDATKTTIGHFQYLGIVGNKMEIRIPSLYYSLLWKPIEKEMLYCKDSMKYKPSISLKANGE